MVQVHPGQPNIMTVQLFFLWVFQALDILTTLIFLKFGIMEGNPVISHWLIGQHTIRNLIAYKLFPSIAAIVWYKIHPEKVWSIILINVVYALVVIWNILSIYRVIS